MPDAQKVIQAPAPAAGADWTVTPSDTDRVRIDTVTAVLVTSATVANRLPALQIVDQNGLIVWAADLQAPQAASETVRYSWARGSGVSASTAVTTTRSLSGPLPFTWLEPGDSLQVVTGAIAAADQWGVTTVRFCSAEEWESLQLLERLRSALGG